MARLGEVYDDAFYADQQMASYRAAVAVLELVGELVRPASVVDVGCGVGTWLRACLDRGIDDVLGVDGDHVRTGELLVPAHRFIAADLRAPLRLGRRFDLAICVEVAEHLPPEAASDFVSSLTDLAPVVLFSAAIPNQGGTGHLNEQWPAYWATRFARRGFRAYDCLRAPLWDDERVAFWYRQNLVLYANDPRLVPGAGTPGEPLALVHPLQIDAILGRIR